MTSESGPKSSEAHPFPDLAEAVRARLQNILERWEWRVRHDLPKADELTFEQARNALPDTLELMADALESEHPQLRRQLEEESSSHGETRFHQNYSLSEMLSEYGLLRPILLEETAIHLRRRLETQELLALDRCIDIIVSYGVMAFVDFQNRKLETAAEARSHYLSFLSHDMRSELFALLLTIDRVKKDVLGGRSTQQSMADLETMRESIQGTMGIMEKFLEAERLRSGKVEVKAAEINVSALVDQTIDQFTSEAGEKGITFKRDVQPDVQCTTDRDLLMLVLRNLLSNAVKYSPEAGIVRVEAAAERGEGGCRVSVIDEGPGMDDATLKKLFTPWQRGETHGQSGFGLGLFIAKQAADLLSAKVWAESEPGQGTCFHLALPENPILS